MRNFLSITAVAVVAATLITSSNLACRRAPRHRAPVSARPSAPTPRDAGASNAAAALPPEAAPKPPAEEVSQLENDWGDAVVAKDWDTACLALEFSLFDPDVCDWMRRKALEGISGPPNPRTLEAFFRRHRVARTSGSIVALLEERNGGDTYEVRVGGRPAFLDTVDTRFSTTGAFRLWAQRQEDEEVTLQSGATRSVAAYAEWPLADQILELGRSHGEDAEAQARRLFEYLRGSWYLDASPTIELPNADEWPAFRDQHRAAGVDAGADHAYADSTAARP